MKDAIGTDLSKKDRAHTWHAARKSRRGTAKQALCSSVTTKLVAAGFAVLSMSSVSADTNGWVYPQRYWSTSGSNVHVWGKAYAHNFGCGLKDCANASHLYFQAGRLSGSHPAATRVNSAVNFSGVGIDVSVSIPAGVSAGFHDAGSSCEHGWWDGTRDWVAVDFGSGKICETSTWGWVSDMSLATTGGVRFGGTWSVRTGSSSIKLGGL